MNSGCYLHAAKDLRPESHGLEAPKADEVQVAIRSTTLCGSDVHYYQHFRNGSIQVLEPLCLGHESAGEIISIGPNSSEKYPELHVGDAVALEVGVPCERCDLCKNGRYNVCPNLRFRSSGSKFPHYQGTIQERINHPAKWVHKLPPQLTFDVGALLEPLAVAIHAVRRSSASAGAVLTGARNTCVIFGAGAIGLLCALAIQAEGTNDIVMVDIDGGRLDFALQHGFAQVVHQVQPKRGSTVEEQKIIARETAKDIGKLRWEDGEAIGQVQRVFECTGAESCLQAAIYVRPLYLQSEQTVDL
jgi:L-iditol 2-dehydrogenase